MFCNKCGNEIILDTEFLYSSVFSCPKCGNIIKSGNVENKNYIENKNSWEYFVDALKKYAVFEGRARRKEYWFFYLYWLVFSIITRIIDAIFNLYILMT